MRSLSLLLLTACNGAMNAPLDGSTLADAWPVDATPSADAATVDAPPDRNGCAGFALGADERLGIPIGSLAEGAHDASVVEVAPDRLRLDVGGQGVVVGWLGADLTGLFDVNEAVRVEVSEIFGGGERVEHRVVGARATLLVLVATDGVEPVEAEGLTLGVGSALCTVHDELIFSDCTAERTTHANRISIETPAGAIGLGPGEHADTGGVAVTYSRSWTVWDVGCPGPTPNGSFLQVTILRIAGL